MSKPVTPSRRDKMSQLIARLQNVESNKSKYNYPLQAPKLAPGVVPKGRKAPVLAMDYAAYDFAAYAYTIGFPGYPYLSQLATRAEYRAFASTLSTELTREWITFTGKEDDDSGVGDKIKIIEEEFERLKIRECMQTCAEHDSYFGKAQMFIDIDGANRKLPLILSPRTVKRDSLNRVTPVEAIWTTPLSYNSNDPVAPDFYRPRSWFMLSQEVHASRLMTIVTRPLPDILKPAFNFGGMSLSQLAEPYVDNWLRTRTSVSDLINNFSLTALKTSMEQTLTSGEDDSDLFKRADLFTLLKSNKGLMLLDMTSEDLVQLNVPLGGLHELQAQSQEHMCSVSRMPAIVLTGISPSGLNASSDGEIRVFYDWIAAQQEAYWRAPLKTISDCVQLSKFGAIDPDIGFEFVPLYQMTPKEQSEIRKSDADAAAIYITNGVIDPVEERERLARDPDSGYQNLDTSIIPVPPGNDPMAGANGDPALGGDPAAAAIAKAKGVPPAPQVREDINA